jgi:hypothetical protein
MYSTIMYPFMLLFMFALPLPSLSAPQGNQVHLIGAYYCTGTHWTGGCAWTEAIDGNCVNIDRPSGSSFSFGPDAPLICKLYEAADCRPSGTVVGGIRYPGWPDVSAMTQNEGLSIVRSWKCEL